MRRKLHARAPKDRECSVRDTESAEGAFTDVGSAYGSAEDGPRLRGLNNPLGS